MSLDPIEAIEQVLDRIDEGCCYGNNWCTGGWLHNAPKEEIINFIYGSLRARVVNALERVRENSVPVELRSALKEISELNDLWFDTFSTDDGQRSIHDDIEHIVYKAMRSLKTHVDEEPKRNCDRFNTGDVKMDAQHAMEAILEEGVAGYRGIAEYLLSPVKEEEPCKRATDATT